eukprot:356351-Chlamydomonas_euryale.AAC.7
MRLPLPPPTAEIAPFLPLSRRVGRSAGVAVDAAAAALAAVLAVGAAAAAAAVAAVAAVAVLAAAVKAAAAAAAAAGAEPVCATAAAAATAAHPEVRTARQLRRGPTSTRFRGGGRPPAGSCLNATGTCPSTAHSHRRRLWGQPLLQCPAQRRRLVPQPGADLLPAQPCRHDRCGQVRRRRR